MLKNRQGFTLVEAVLIIVTLAAIGFAGWTWYQANQTEEVANNSEETEETEEDEESNTPEGWTEYHNEELGFAFAYPEEWGEVSKGSSVEESFISSFENSEVAFGVISKAYLQYADERNIGRGGAMFDYQGFEEKNGQFFRVKYEENLQKQVEDEPLEGYVEMTGANTEVLLNTSHTFFNTSMTHLMFNLDDDNFPAMNIYVKSSDSDSSELSNVADTVEVF